jgi:uncharacterized protein (PEP-CTERM system associated)
MLAGCALASATACAQTWHFYPSAQVEEVLTDNVNLAPSDRAKADFVSQITPGLRITEKGARSSLTGFVELPILIYARTGAENDRVLPQAALSGSIAPVENFFFIDGAASIRQEYFSPFGAQPVGLVNATENRVRTDSYRVSPYVKSLAGAEVNYELRDDSIWTHLSGAPGNVRDSFTNSLTGHIARKPRPFGWALEIERTEDKFYGSDQPSFVTQLARARLPFQVDPEFQVSASGGYEDNRYALSHPSGTIYGAGFEFRRAPRTALKGQWEHRFFGSSYLLTLDERTALSTLNVKLSRNITSYPQEIAALPGGTDVQSILNQILLSRFPDPAERQSFIDQLIQSGGLPATLSSPVVLYAQQIYLQELATATVGLLGARNRVLFTAFRLRTEQITGAGAVPPILGAFVDQTQLGGSIVWTHSLTPTFTFNGTAIYQHSEANSPRTGSTRQGSVVATLVSRLSPQLSVHAGLRFQNLESDIANPYREAAIFAGLSYIYGASSSRGPAGKQPVSGY